MSNQFLRSELTIKKPKTPNPNISHNFIDIGERIPWFITLLGLNQESYSEGIGAKRAIFSH
ncbi:MAG: hypothetical protein ACI94O_000285 [Octadecabacter sp.]